MTSSLGRVNQLNTFSRHPLILSKRNQCTDDELIIVFHEHCCREVLRDFVTSVLQTMTHGEMEFQKTVSLDMLSEMLPYSKLCDLVQVTVSSIVNKFGDSSKKVKCHAINTLVKVLNRHKHNLH